MRSCIAAGMRNEASFRDLKVWQVSMTLVEDIYRVTTSFPAA